MMNSSSDPLGLLACGQAQQALQAAEAGLEIDFNNADLYNIAGICAITLGDHERAEHYWRQTIRLNPNASEAYFNLGLLCARSQRDELRLRFGWGQSPVVIYSGTVPLNHDLDIAISAVQTALGRYPSLRWVIIASGDGLDSLHTAVAKAGIESAVEYHLVHGGSDGDDEWGLRF